MAEEEKNKQAKKEAKPASRKVAVIRIRGSIKVKKEITDTLDMLKLYDTNNCVILTLTPSIIGMLKKVQSYVTWGDVDEETLKILKDKRGEKIPFKLQPPKKGFGRKGIKIPFKLGGALGERKEKINDLIQRMI